MGAWSFASRGLAIDDPLCIVIESFASAPYLPFSDLFSLNKSFVGQIQHQIAHALKYLLPKFVQVAYLNSGQLESMVGVKYSTCT